MTKIHSEFCPVCNGKELLPLVTCTDNLVTKEEFDILKCTDCGFALTQDFPAEKYIGKYYDAADYVSHSDTSKGIVNRLYHIVRKISLKSKSKLVSVASGKQIGNILDIGAGTGYFLNEIKTRGWTVSGIEKSELARLAAASKFGINCDNSEKLFDIESSSKDVITMWHVLEHVEKLNETVATIHRILKPDGVALIALPNRASFDAVYYKEQWAAYDVPRHLWHFSIPDFTRLANKHGFEVVKIKPMYFDGFYISMLSEQNKKVFMSTVVGLIRGGWWFLKSVLNKQKCSSVIYILKKK